MKSLVILAFGLLLMAPARAAEQLVLSFPQFHGHYLGEGWNERVVPLEIPANVERILSGTVVLAGTAVSGVISCWDDPSPNSLSAAISIAIRPPCVGGGYGAWIAEPGLEAGGFTVQLPLEWYGLPSTGVCPEDWDLVLAGGVMVRLVVPGPILIPECEVEAPAEITLNNVELWLSVDRAIPMGQQSWGAVKALFEP